MKTAFPILLALGLLAAPAYAAPTWRGIAKVGAEYFDGVQRHWASLPVLLQTNAEAEKVRLRLGRLPSGRPLTARLNFTALPHYDDWVAKRKEAGGPAWSALKLLLDEIGKGPAMALTQQALPVSGEMVVLLGLRKNGRFELYVTLPGSLEPCGKALCFEPGEPIFAKTSASLAWKALKPLARAQAKAAAKR